MCTWIHSIPSLSGRTTIAHWLANFCMPLQGQIPESSCIPHHSAFQTFFSLSFLFLLYVFFLFFHFIPNKPFFSPTYLSSTPLILSVAIHAVISSDFVFLLRLSPFCHLFQTDPQTNTAPLSISTHTHKHTHIQTVSLPSCYFLSTQSGKAERTQQVNQHDSHFLMMELDSSLPQRTANVKLKAGSLEASIDVRVNSPFH